MTAEELLNQTSNDDIAVHSVEEDTVLVIDPSTRTINIPVGFHLLGVESDMRSELVRFQCPKIVGNNIDLSKASIRINFVNANNEPDQNYAQNIQVSGDNVTFDWELTDKVTMYEGKTEFVVYAFLSNSEGIITNKWHTTIAESPVLKGITVEITGGEELQARDVLKQLINEATEQIEQKAAETLETIPEDYTQLQKDVSSLSESITEIIDKEYYPNLLDKDAFIVGKQFATPAGSEPTELIDNPNTTVTNIIDCDGNEYFETNLTNGNCVIC